MKTRSTIALLMVAALAGCAVAPRIGGPGLRGADIASMRPDCQPGMAAKTVVIKVRSDDFGVDRPLLCVKPGDTVTFRVAGNPRNATVRVAAKSVLPASWLEGSVTGENSFSVTVPDDASGLYLYNVDVPGFGTVDPMISVED